jgi:hypothetical protein
VSKAQSHDFLWKNGKACLSVEFYDYAIVPVALGDIYISHSSLCSNFSSSVIGFGDLYINGTEQLANTFLVCLFFFLPKPSFSG